VSSQLNLDNVNEKVFAKLHSVKNEKIEVWKDDFVKGLSNIGFKDKILGDIENDLKKLLNQKENTCVFQARDFNEKYEDTSSIFSIYIGIVKI